MSDLTETETMDPDDIAVRTAREHSPTAIAFLAFVLQDREADTADRIQAARHILEVAGCLSL